MSGKVPDGVLECWEKSSGSYFNRSDYIEIRIDTPKGICSLFHYSSTPVLHFGLFKTIPFQGQLKARSSGSGFLHDGQRRLNAEKEEHRDDRYE